MKALDQSHRGAWVTNLGAGDEINEAVPWLLFLWVDRRHPRQIGGFTARFPHFEALAPTIEFGSGVTRRLALTRTLQAGIDDVARYIASTG